MKTRWLHLLALIAVLSAAPTLAETLPAPENQTAPETRIELEKLRQDFRHLDEVTRLRVDSLKTTNAERIRSLEQTIARQDERIRDFSGRADWVAVVVTILAIFIALVSAGSFVFTHRRALAEIKGWIEEHAPDEVKRLADNAISGSLKEVEEKKREAEQIIGDAQKKVEQDAAEFSEMFEQTQELLARKEDAKIPEKDKETIIGAAQGVAAKPPDEKTFRDWELQGVSAYIRGDFAKAAEAFNNAARSGDASPTRIAKALFSKGAALGMAEKPDEALTVYDEVVNRFGDSEEPSICEWVARALFNKGLALDKTGRPGEALLLYDEVINRFGDPEKPAFSKQFAMALVGKGIVLGRTERHDEALTLFDEVVNRFGDSKEPSLKETVASAHNSTAFLRLRLAKRALHASGGEGEGQVILLKAEADIEAALMIIPDNAVFLGNKGYILFLLGRDGEAEPVLRRTLELGGERLRDTELEDADIHPLPQDEAFKALIHRLWDEVSRAKDGGK